LQAAYTQSLEGKRRTMAITAAKIIPLVGFTLPGTPYSVRMARFYVWATLSRHGLADFADDAETITAELVSNAVAHAGAQPLSLALASLDGTETIAITVRDSSPCPPVLLDPPADEEHGRGLQVVNALAARWGWQWLPQEAGKWVYAFLAGQA
jgi:anti-sigma regulatory factor (Ser/Thr protein kinase)